MQKIIWFCLNLRQLSFAIEKKSTDRQTHTHTHTHRHFSENDFFSCFECSRVRICNNLEHDFFAITILPFLKEYGSNRSTFLLINHSASTTILQSNLYSYCNLYFLFVSFNLLNSFLLYASYRSFLLSTHFVILLSFPFWVSSHFVSKFYIIFFSVTYMYIIQCLCTSFSILKFYILI